MTVSEGNLYSMRKYLVFILMFWAAAVSAQKDSAIVPTVKPSVYAESALTKSAEFPGGHQAFVTAILKNFRTSPLVKAGVMSARAVASFIVDTDGNMVNIKIESYESEMVKDEFLRALKMVKTQWIPAEEEGKKVRSLMRQPLVFNLQ